MERFCIIQPLAALAPYIRHYWLLESDDVTHVQRIIPTGHVELVFHRAYPLTVMPNLAISWAPDFHPSANGVLIHLKVDNIETTLECICMSGGRTIRPKTKIEVEGLGYFALFADSEGNTLGLYSE